MVLQFLSLVYSKTIWTEFRIFGTDWQMLFHTIFMSVFMTTVPTCEGSLRAVLHLVIVQATSLKEQWAEFTFDH